MRDNDLKYLSRAELLELLIAQMEENQKLQAELNDAKKQLEDRHIILKKAGSIAEAALELNQIFEAADRAAKQYVESVYHIVDNAKKPKQQKDTENARKKAESTEN